jgi:hypothetical protein
MKIKAEIILFRHSGMRPLAQARNPYSPSWLWIPGSRFARPGMTKGNFTAPQKKMDCFAEPVIGRRFAPTGWLAMTALGLFENPTPVASSSGLTGRSSIPRRQWWNRMAAAYWMPAFAGMTA